MTELTVIRGAVEIAPKTETAKIALKNNTSDLGSGNKQVTLVKAGYSADIPSITVAPTTKIEKVEPKVELRKTTEEEFIGIHKASTIQKEELASMPNTSQETQTQIEKLEKKATDTVLKDIKKT